MKVRAMLMIGIATLFAIVVGTVLWTATRGPGRAGSSKWQLPTLGDVPDFSLSESGGGTLRRSDLREKVWIASFIFTRCAEACPAMMRQEVGVQGQLPLRDDLRLVSFSVDPDFDTPTVLAQYAKAFGADKSRWLFLTGDKKVIYDLAQRGFQLNAVGADPAKEMPILHSSKLALVDRRGSIRGYYDTANSAELRQLVTDVRKLLAERS